MKTESMYGDNKQVQNNKITLTHTCRWNGDLSSFYQTEIAPPSTSKQEMVSDNKQIGDDECN